jgi:hypothetical protein
VKGEYELTGRVAWTPRHYCYVVLEKDLLRPLESRDYTAKQSQKNAFAWMEQRIVEWREAKKLPWEAVAEEDRPTSSYYSTHSLRSHIEWLGNDFYIANIWRGQETRIEVFTEKLGLYDALRRVCDPYGVVVSAIKGQDSAGHVHDGALRMRRRLEKEGQVTEVLYVGDLDPYGCLIEHSLYERLNRYGYRCAPPIRVALTLDQALELPDTGEELDLKNKVHQRFHRDYPELPRGIHVEALPGVEIQRIVTKAVSMRMDIAAINESIALSNAVRAYLTDQTQEAIRYYEEHALGRSLYEAIREPGSLVHGVSGKPFSEEVLKRYLAKDDDADEDDEDVDQDVSGDEGDTDDSDEDEDSDA